MFPALGAVLGLLHPVAGGVLRRGLEFRTCTSTLNKSFFNNSGNFWVPPHMFTLDTEVNNFVFNFICVLGSDSPDFI